MFKDFKDAVNKKMSWMIENSNGLLKTSVTKNVLWNTYIRSFPASFDPETGKVALMYDPDEGKTISLPATKHTCKACRTFIRNVGNVVAIVEGELVSIWDIQDSDLDLEYKAVAKEMSKIVKSHNISKAFISNESVLGTDHNFCTLDTGEIVRYEHFSYVLPVGMVNSGSSVEEKVGEINSNKDVFVRGLDELTVGVLDDVISYINGGSILNGEAHLNSVKQFKSLLIEYITSEVSDSQLWVWDKVLSVDSRILKFRNTLIGVLCSELAQGINSSKACENWNKRVDPVNYRKAKAPITQRQIEEAKKFVQDNDFEESFNRRLATIDDIKVTEIKHINRKPTTSSGVSIFDNVKASKSTSSHKKSDFDKAPEVHIEEFIEKILPNCTSVEALLQNDHSKNMVNITTSVSESSKRIFNWDNNYSYTFNGNLAGKSQIKDAVKSFGGNVEGVLRFSIMWADGDGDNSDLDAHCIINNSSHVYYGRSSNPTYSVSLDVDIRYPSGKLAVENIVFTDPLKLPKEVKFFVNQFSERNSRGFKAEIEYNGVTYHYNYNQPVRGNVNVASFSIDKGISHILTPDTETSTDIWGLETNRFHPVNLLCLSPNHWGENAFGNKHYMFMLEGCKNKDSVRGFHNEHLIPELSKHRKVLEVLGSTSLIEPSQDQLAGIGFNATVRDSLVVRIKGKENRVLKIIF